MVDSIGEMEGAVENKPATTRKNAQKWMVIFGSFVAAYIVYDVLYVKNNFNKNQEAEDQRKAPPKPKIYKERNVSESVNMDKINEIKKAANEQLKNVVKNLTESEKYELMLKNEVLKFNHGQRIIAMKSYGEKTIAEVSGGKSKQISDETEGKKDKRISSDDYVASVMKRAQNNIDKFRTSLGEEGNTNQNQPINNDEDGVIIDTFNGNPNDYLMPAATVMNISLLQKINSDFQGRFLGILNNDVYAVGKTIIVIPKGCKIIGQAKKYSGVNEIIQARQMLVAEWVVLPNGNQIRLSGIGDVVDREGQAGIPGDVNYHFGWKLFGAGATALIGISSDYEGSGENQNQSFTGDLGKNTRELASEQTQDYMDLKPTVVANIGDIIKFQTTNGVRLPSWGRVYDY